MAGRFARHESAALWLRLIISLILAAALTSADHRYGLSDQAAPLLSLITQPLIAIAIAPGEFLESVQSHYRTTESLIEENQRLRKQLLENFHRLRARHQVEEENLRLRSLAELDTPLYSKRLLVAEVTQINTRTFRQTITINRGRQDGAYIGQPALDIHGIVGQVANVGPFQSTVLLINDIRHALMVRNARTGDRYLAHGNGQRLELRYVPRHNDLKIGDYLLTSGLDDTYPAEHLVGQVVKITPHSGRDFLEAEVQPNAQLQRNREILLVWYRQPTEEQDDDS